jgi:RNA processing factor Prp31
MNFYCINYKGLNFQAIDELLANEEQYITLVNEVTSENNNVSVLTRFESFLLKYFLLEK